jgi:acyl carrier protein
MMQEDAVSKIVAEQLGIDPEQARAADDLWSAGLSSLAAVRILMDLEDAFEIVLPPDSLTRETFSSVARLVAVVELASTGTPQSGVAG